MNNPDPKRFNLNPFSTEIKEGISLFTAIRNRKKTLEAALKTWVTHEQIDEIIIVDWDSDESLVPLINDLRDERIVLVIAKQQKRWIQTRAFNLGARFSSRNKIIKIDGDIKLNKGFFDKHPLKEGSFYTGNWALGRDSNETHINGTVFLFRNDFFNVNGYNELLKLYGYDDTDLYIRLEESGLKRCDIDNDFIFHIEHENRVTAKELSDYMDKLSDSQKADISILMNRHLLAKSFSWSKSNQMMEIDIEQINPNVYQCTTQEIQEPIIPDEILQESVIIAMKERLQFAGQELSDRLFATGDRNEIIDLYFIFQNKKGNPTYENIYNLIHKYDQVISNTLCKKDDDIDSLNDKLQFQNSRIDELINKIDSLHGSYSWQAGHFFISLIDKILSIFYDKKK